MKHLLVTNDFPPKVGGIQSYLWELWRRLDPAAITVLTTPYAGAAAFDEAAGFRVVRDRDRVLLPHRGLVGRINRLAADVGAEMVVVDPALPLGLVGPRLELPYVVVLHGAEITVPGRLPVTRQLLASVLRGADGVIAAGRYPLAEAERAAGRPLRSVVVEPGVDTDRFVPTDAERRAELRAEFGLAPDATVVTSISRLVPRKGMDTLIRAAARLAPGRPDLVVAIAGSGRDRARLERLAISTGAPVVFMGRIPEDRLVAFHQCGDVFAMLCRDRWGGLEQEGFGIVFVEAAACGVPQVAGRSGGSHEAVAHGESGLVVDRPTDVVAVAETIEALLGRSDLEQLGTQGLQRAREQFSYGLLAERLGEFLDCGTRP